MNRRGFFGALVGGVAALATGKLLPEKKNDLGKNAWVDAEAMEKRVQRTTGLGFSKQQLDNLIESQARLIASQQESLKHLRACLMMEGPRSVTISRPDWVGENCVWIHET